MSASNDSNELNFRLPKITHDTAVTIFILQLCRVPPMRRPAVVRNAAPVTAARSDSTVRAQQECFASKQRDQTYNNKTTQGQEHEVKL